MSHEYCVIVLGIFSLSILLYILLSLVNWCKLLYNCVRYKCYVMFCEVKCLCAVYVRWCSSTVFLVSILMLSFLLVFSLTSLDLLWIYLLYFSSSIWFVISCFYLISSRYWSNITRLWTCENVKCCFPISVWFGIYNRSRVTCLKKWVGLPARNKNKISN